MLHNVIDLLRGNAVLVGLAVGALTPLLTSIFQQPRWGKKVRITVAGAVSVLVGFAVAAANGDLDNPADLVSIVTAVIVAAEAFYQKVWSAIGITGKIEKATALKGGKVDPYDCEAYWDEEWDDADYGDEPAELEQK